MNKVLLFSLLIFFSCAEFDIWGYKASEFEKDIKDGNWEKIDSIDLNEENLNDLNRSLPLKEEGAAYFLGLRRYYNDDYQNYEHLMRYQAENSNEKFNVHLLAADHFADWLAETEQWEKLYQFVLSKKISFSGLDDKQYYLFLSLYKQKKFTEVLKLKEKYSSFNEEAELMFLVSRQETEVPGFYSGLPVFISKAENNTILYRLYLYTLSDEIEIPETDVNLVNARLLSAAEQYKDAAEYYKLVMVKNAASMLHEPLIKSMLQVFEKTGESRFMREYMTSLFKLSENDEDLHHFILWEWAKQERKFENYSKSADLFEKLHKLKPEWKKEDTLWFWYDSMAKTDIKSYLENLDYLTLNWDDPEYYNDTFDYVLSTFVVDRNWKGVDGFYDFLVANGHDYIVSRAAFTLLLMDHYGRYKIGSSRKKQLMQSVDLPEAHWYYRTMFQLITGAELTIFDAEEVLEEELGIEEELVLLYQKYALFDDSYDYARKNYRKFSLFTIYSLSTEFQLQKLYYESLRLLNLSMNRSGWKFDNSFFNHFYPPAYQEEIRDAAAGEEIPEPVFYGLIRQESAFTPDIVSRAGATGLSQLMTATAAEVARKLGMGEYDLNDPLDNLRIGSYYFSALRRRYDDFSTSLYAYNAGQGRYRQWQKSVGDLEPMLFLEAIPYRSTRNYVRTVFTSALFYGQLYLKQNPMIVGLWFFADFNTIKFN